MNKTFILFSILFLLSLLGQAQEFRFALFTDVHVTQDSIAANDLQRAVRQVNATPGLSFVLVSGDLTEAGDRASMNKVKEILSELNIKYYITSGNHETKWSESGATDFSRIYGSDRFSFCHNGCLFLGFNTGPVLRMADGHVAPQDIAWLKEELSKAGKQQPVFLVTHYPLLDGDVDNWYELTDAVRPYNIRAFLGGHYHSNRLLSYDGIPAFINRSTLRAKQAVGGYSLYQVTSDSISVSEQLIGGDPHKWGAYSMTKQYFTEDASSYPRPNLSVNSLYPQVKESWIVRTGKGIYSSPVYADGRVYVGDDLGYLTCFSLKDGRQQWNYRTEARIVGTPAVDNGVVVFGSADGNIYGLNARRGEFLWRIPTKAAVLGAVSTNDGIAFVGGSDNTFRAVKIATGKILWEYDGLNGYVETRPLLYKGMVIFGAWDGHLYALDSRTGKLVWKWAGPITRMHYSPAAVWPVAANGKVFITAPDRVLTAIDAQSGQTVWRTKQSVVRETIGLSADKQRIYSKTMQDSVVCYSTVGNVPHRIWSTNVGFGYEHAPSMPIERDGIVYGSTKNGLMFGLDAFNGKLLWKHKVGNSLISTLVPLSKSRCLFAGTEGIVGLLNISIIR
ncbi:MAG: PQQ-binding-like beta-propeller repeat protein [Bacteroidaceae bacterium]